ncbi:alkaline phosphatase D family protein [Aliiglaciecola sp. 3_MG-2023]|uniref:alkaline phosphatase D family protein n=1 Tax=Aliiglaciecola sp. 3_MG-2023 TaxID=3062644 RepID=UPI0034A0D226
MQKTKPSQNSQQVLPPIIAGPILRAISETSITLWMLVSHKYEFNAKVWTKQSESLFDQNIKQFSNIVKVGEKAFIYVTTLPLSETLTEGSRCYYDISINDYRGARKNLKDLMPDIVYGQQSTPSFYFNKRIKNVLHGSCRKPHHTSQDGMLAVDLALEESFEDHTSSPDLLLLSGDQAYIDDVAGPTLVAINHVIERLGLFQEELLGATIENSKQLLTDKHCYYQRPTLLPDNDTTETVMSYFFKGKKKPIFTSVNANNHLISFAEVIGMYALIWSPEMWHNTELKTNNIAPQFAATYAEELKWVEDFKQGLPRVRRAMAHIPVYMIFDDHDVTDDWNLTRGWEEAVYNNAFAKRIVGNALIGYWLCQGWGNDVSKLSPLTEKLVPFFTDTGITEHEKVIDILLHWDQWHYTLDTQPKIVVLDTRTQRWRSESSLSKPSGLMDWEALCDLQQELINQPSVIMVSPAPIFGVKLIETIQRIFTFFGRALMVDAENWMAHKGTASVILNIFRHYKTPPHFVILSGDVHYSFVYDITLKFRRNSPHITQITSSGIKNEFPHKLLSWFDKLNRILFGTKSPLNWFTQRRNMTIRHRRPNNQQINTLLNGSGIGQVKVNRDCTEVDASVLLANGKKVKFITRD